MPRQPRLDLPGQLYHVMVRGVEQRSIFMDALDKSDFLGRLAKGLAQTGSACFAWALMTNHLHLLIMSGASGLAALMQPVLTGYVGGFNRRHQRVGHLVQNRFKAILCHVESYFQELVRYIHLNPVRAGLVQTLGQLDSFAWTGHAALMGRIALPWQAVDATLSHFGDTAQAAQAAYQKFLLDGWSQGHRDDLEGGGLLRSAKAAGIPLSAREGTAYDDRILGPGDFVETIHHTVDEQERRMKAAQQTIDVNGLLTQAALTAGVDPAAVLSGSRERSVARARSLFAYGATKLLGRPSREIAAMLRMGSGAFSVSRRRGESLAASLQFPPGLVKPS